MTPVSLLFLKINLPFFALKTRMKMNCPYRISRFCFCSQYCACSRFLLLDLIMFAGALVILWSSSLNRLEVRLTFPTELVFTLGTGCAFGVGILIDIQLTSWTRLDQVQEDALLLLIVLGTCQALMPFHTMHRTGLLFAENACHSR